MDIINLNSEIPKVVRINNTHAFNLESLKEIWVFNCGEGSQHKFVQKKLKINLISKLIITNSNINNLSGLLGLLSSLSLSNRKKALHIYSNKNMNRYLELSIKYSKTNFKYNIYFHILKTGLIIDHSYYQVYAIINIIKIEFLIISKEKFGKFKLKKAKKFNIIEGPIYGRLKQGHNLIFPDGIIIHGTYFTDDNKSGNTMSTISYKYHKRNTIEISNKSQVIHNLL